jgi:pyrroloquinoline quinone biosynthesis protein B
MRIRVLGSAAGGGVPQWNCGCDNCREARAGGRVAARTQDSLAVTVDDERWVLLNASPDILAQLAATPALHPRARRHTPIAAIVLTNGDLDHVLGLFSLRESQPLAVYATRAVWRGLADRNVVVRTLERFAGQLVFRPLELGHAVAIDDPEGRPTGLDVTAIAAAGKAAVHLADQPTSREDNVALLLRDRRHARLCAYAPGVGRLEPPLVDALASASCVFFDGTFFDEEELARQGLGSARARDMAHLPIGGPEGSLARLASLPALARIYTHVNNSNPILDPATPERRAVDAAGWQVAHDGLEVVP